MNNWRTDEMPPYDDGTLAVVYLLSDAPYEHYNNPIIVSCWSTKLKTTVEAIRIDREHVLRWQLWDILGFCNAKDNRDVDSIKILTNGINMSQNKILNLNWFGMTPHPTDTYIYWSTEKQEAQNIAIAIRKVYDECIQVSGFKELLDVVYSSGANDERDCNDPDL